MPSIKSSNSQKDKKLYNLSYDGKKDERLPPQKPFKSHPLRDIKPGITNQEIRNYFKSSMCQPKLSSDSSQEADTPKAQSGKSNIYKPDKPEGPGFDQGESEGPGSDRDDKKADLLKRVAQAHKMSGGFFKIDYGDGSDDSSSIFSSSQGQSQQSSKSGKSR